MEPDVEPVTSCSSRSLAENIIDAHALISDVPPCSAERTSVEETAGVVDVMDAPTDLLSPEVLPDVASVSHAEPRAIDAGSMTEGVERGAADAEPSSSVLGCTSLEARDAAGLDMLDRSEVADAHGNPPDTGKDADVEPSSWQLGSDSIKEEWEAQKSSEEVDALGSEALLAKEKIAAAISCEAESRQRKRHESEQNKRLEKVCEVSEWQTFSLGPFKEGCQCEILEATYGVPGEPDKLKDVTEQVLMRWAEQSTGGLKLKGYNAHFGDPAPWDMRKKLTVRYRLSHTRGDVRAWDVSHGQYAEGIAAKGSQGLVTTVKLMTNLVGVTMAAAGYTAGMVSTAATRQISKNDSLAVDSMFSRMGFQSWLLSNGIFPNLTFDPLDADAATALETFYAEVGLELPEKPFRAEDIKMTPLVVSNHISYLDGMVLAHSLECPRIIAAAGTTRTPFVGKFAEELVIEVDRNDADSRMKTLEAIRSHVTSWTPGGRPLLVFPEGTTSNGDELLEFRRGAFVNARPVRPVVLFYTGAWHPANTNFRENSQGEIQATSESEWYGQFFGHLTHTLQVRVLKPYVPNAAEREDPLLFARNVRQVMSKAYAELRDEHVRSRAEQQRSITSRASMLPQMMFGETETWGQCGRHRKAAAPNRSRSVPASRSPFSPADEG